MSFRSIIGSPARRCNWPSDAPTRSPASVGERRGRQLRRTKQKPKQMNTTETQILATLNGPLRHLTRHDKSCLYLDWELNQPRPSTMAPVTRVSRRSPDVLGFVAAWAKATGRTGGQWKTLRRSRLKTLQLAGLKCPTAEAMMDEMATS
jgi:hypothetical protein